ncbi:unnamed protein product [Rotaria magnacalcarata]|uniref:AB hydrolase-1 domain-containing protein n=2 Tax=Rotaria magnacalcarata TaxID=392030 RepID=A0A819H9K1_9BILA|nr:unnamed protein product [Rotaria magnacalcarata]CAF1665904.1 unnamed protein product [Rotaria magnacalcarata]CAF2048241.1 unnamed protein product [Rotaria magnacalcarata]CAF2072263.1 unnamed protein product [Rotaria magnacalcarata]CAF2078886.1 unnamed protein product [Rotaria magnacalcarata]
MIRRISKSRKRNFSPSRTQVDIQFESGENAYSDPIDSCRSLVQDVVFERRDCESLSPQATELFNSVTIFQDEAEASWLLNNIHSTTILVKVDKVEFSINGNYYLKENQPCVLFLHGFGPARNWTNWIKLAYQLSQQCQYSIILIDLPGFGLSSGRSLDQTSWKRHGPEILIAVLSSFHLRHSVSVVAQCGGAATTVRTINRYPLWFRGRGLIFSNSVIGDFGESKIGDFEKNLTKYNIHIVVYWIPDQDHSKYCVAYKRWNKLRVTGFRHLQLIDLDPAKQTMKQFYPAIRVIGLSRCSSKNEACVYKLSDEFIKQVIDKLDRKA